MLGTKFVAPMNDYEEAVNGFPKGFENVGQKKIAYYKIMKTNAFFEYFKKYDLIAS